MAERRLTQTPVAADPPPLRGTDYGDWYWEFAICRDRGRCGRPAGTQHKMHVQYDVGGQILGTWRSNEYYESHPIAFVE
ncbi:hypothetical protein [Kribbella sp. NPDC051718]|uniref:hypothetical protein n=1 Tax=Kribbella sp. NPDC051718 TaxID=3155168 RepID=UPI00343EFC15